MTRKIRLRPLRWLWALLLLMPPIVGYAGTGDPLATLQEIPNREAKGDRLPILYPAETAWTSCRAGAALNEAARYTKQNISCRDIAEGSMRQRDAHPAGGVR
jgi:hypothetical protein